MISSQIKCQLYYFDSYLLIAGRFEDLCLHQGLRLCKKDAIIQNMWYKGKIGHVINILFCKYAVYGSFYGHFRLFY